ncbi:MAG: serine/threonine-protein kinase [Balneolaceae bacterium]|nr:serine/threonine-protein kinase [Balneolaceae bacterium]
MDAERWNRVQTLFKEIIDLDKDSQAERLRDLYRTDPQLYREVSTLLAADSDETSILDGFAVDRIDLSGLFSLSGSVVGPFELVEKIGEGGMGTVYEARRVEGGFDQCVALKLIRHEFGTDRERQHFERERRILALLEHPNISRLIDGGVTGSGIPWFAMELVEGIPIDEFCREHKLPADSILELFSHVLVAVRFAHRNLVVHHDLKPVNILISENHGEPMVKLLDFGIASVVDDAHHTEARAMTMAYASPEQKQGSITTTSTDIYSLGVIF